MINYIDIQSCKALNETNKERIHKHQAELIVKVQEFERLCLKKVNVDNFSDFQMIIEQAETKLNGSVVSQAEVNRVNGFLSNELLKVEKVLFKDKSMYFLKADEIDDEVYNDDNEVSDKDDNEVFDKDDDEVSDEDYDDRHIADNLRIVSLLIKENNLLGLLITVEDCFIQKESFDKK